MGTLVGEPLEAVNEIRKRYTSKPWTDLAMENMLDQICDVLDAELPESAPWSAHVDVPAKSLLLDVLLICASDYINDDGGISVTISPGHPVPICQRIEVVMQSSKEPPEPPAPPPVRMIREGPNWPWGRHGRWRKEGK